jgi:hypothetical protein
MTIGQLGMKHPSLAAMVEAVKTTISRVAMHKKFSPAAVAFMQKCSAYILNQKLSTIRPIKAELLNHFKRILISGWYEPQRILAEETLRCDTRAGRRNWRPAKEE